MMPELFKALRVTVRAPTPSEPSVAEPVPLVVPPRRRTASLAGGEDHREHEKWGY